MLLALVMLPLPAYFPAMAGADQVPVGEQGMPCHGQTAAEQAACPDCDGPGPGCSCCDHTVPASLVDLQPMRLAADPSATVFTRASLPRPPEPPPSGHDRPPRQLLI